MDQKKEKNSFIGQLIVRIVQNFIEEDREKFVIFIPINEKFIYAKKLEPSKKSYVYYLVDIETKEQLLSEKVDLEFLYDHQKFNEKNQTILGTELLWDIQIEGNVMKIGNLICKLNMTSIDVVDLQANLKNFKTLCSQEDDIEPVPKDHWCESC